MADQTASAQTHAHMRDIHAGADFLLGVIVALAIEKAMEGFLHGLNHSWLVDPLRPLLSETEMSPGLFQKCLEFARLIVFMVMIVRFYFGWIFYSHKMHLEAGLPNPAAYRRDFFSALFHFALFYAWSLTITTRMRFWLILNSFVIGMVAVLLYDILWVRWLHATGSARKWAWRNGMTVVWCSVLLLIFTLAGSSVVADFPATALLAEFLLVLVPVFLISRIDILETIKGADPEAKLFVLFGPAVKL